MTKFNLFLGKGWNLSFALDLNVVKQHQVQPVRGGAAAHLDRGGIGQDLHLVAHPEFGAAAGLLLHKGDGGVQLGRGAALIRRIGDVGEGGEQVFLANLAPLTEDHHPHTGGRGGHRHLTAVEGHNVFVGGGTLGDPLEGKTGALLKGHDKPVDRFVGHVGDGIGLVGLGGLLLGGLLFAAGGTDQHQHPAQGQ